VPKSGTVREDRLGGEEAMEMSPALLMGSGAKTAREVAVLCWTGASIPRRNSLVNTIFWGISARRKSVAVHQCRCAMMSDGRPAADGYACCRIFPVGEGREYTTSTTVTDSPCVTFPMPVVSRFYEQSQFGRGL
jgi:hypothetical protein